MNYLQKLDEILTEDGAQESNIMIDKGKNYIIRAVNLLPEKPENLKIKGAEAAINYLLKSASAIASKKANKKLLWRMKPKYEPLKENKEYEVEIIQYKILTKEGVRLIIKAIENEETPDQSKILKSIIKEIIKTAKYKLPFNKKDKIQNIVNGYVDKAIKNGKTSLKIDVRGLNRETVDDVYQSYLKTFEKLGMASRTIKFSSDLIHIDFKDSYDIRKLVELKAPTILKALAQGEDPQKTFEEHLHALSSIGDNKKISDTDYLNTIAKQLLFFCPGLAPAQAR